MPIPLEISSPEGIRKMNIGKDGLVIKSSTPPRVDENGYYLKKITYL
jgi:predicted regulator of Ras-like GTPase activity (Roadblock/LC7/MglB family)